MNIVYFDDTRVGRIAVTEEDGCITGLVFAAKNPPGEGSATKKTQLAETAVRQLREYFDGEREVFDLPIRLTGSEFQKRVWNALLDIPYAETRSYKQIAEQLGNKNSARAVGMANNKNPISIIVPCHRVIGSDGGLVGYGGGLDVKAALLALEESKRTRTQRK